MFKAENPVQAQPPQAVSALAQSVMWVSATATRNFMFDDPILDWLELFGADKGFVRDDLLDGYDERADYTCFLLKKGKEFEAAVVRYLRALEARHGTPHIRTIERRGAANPDDTSGRMCLDATHAAMREGVAVIYQGMVCDPTSHTYGYPDFLVLSSVLGKLFPNMIGSVDTRTGAPGIGATGHHYVVVDAKYSTLKLNAQQELGNDDSQQAYKAQLFLYNRALGVMQGFTPRYAYLLGRGWTQGKHRVDNAVDHLGLAPQDGALTHGDPLAPKVEEAVQWIRRLHQGGTNWVTTPAPSVEELRPNLKNTEDAPWHYAKHQIASDQGEITLLWQVGIEARRNAVREGITNWRDRRCTAASLGVKGAYLSKVQAIMAVNRDDLDPPVRPPRVTAGETTWRNAPPLEFFVDFETVNNLDDDFSAFPKKGGQALIFMIGCGHLENGTWRFECFTARQLDEPSEADIIGRWIQHMETVRRMVAPNLVAPIVYHWSFAEISTLESAYNSAVRRHQNNRWITPQWYDLLKNVVLAEPFVVRGSMRFGLKSVAKGLYALGLIETNWVDGIADGLGAMAAAWWVDNEARATGVTMETLPLMKSVIQYNEIDCRVMMEILQYIRTHH